MVTLARIVISFLVALFLSSCAFDINLGKGKKGNGEVVKDAREVTEEFSVVSVSEGLDVYVEQATDFRIVVEADENVIDLIATDVKNGKLHVHTVEHIGRATKKIHVSLPLINGLKSSSGANLRAKGFIETETIKLRASSGSDMKIELVAGETDARASSGAKITLSGETGALGADASSGADIKARDLRSKICRADASSGAGISVNVSESLVAEASSGGDVSYTGTPRAMKNKSISGSVRRN